MAATITTQTTLKADYLVLVSELDRLVDAAEFDDDSCVGLHTAAWNALQRDLRKRRQGLEEADIADTSVLQHACHLWVLARLYEMSSLGDDSDKVESAKFFSRYRKEMREVQIDDGVMSASETFLVRA